MSMIAPLHETWRRRAIIGHLVQKALTSSYRTKSLGFLWALLDPLLFMGVYYLVFGQIMAHRPLPFMLHIFVGVISFRFLSTSASQASGCLRQQSGLIRDISFPRAILPISVVLSRLVDFAAAWVVVVPLCLVFGVMPTWHWVFVPFIMLIQVALVMGLSFLTAYVGVFFADIENVLRVGLRLWFYLSPVLYDLERVRKSTEKIPELYTLYTANPMCALLESYRACALNEKAIPVGHLACTAGLAVALLLVGFAIFVRSEGQLAKYV